MNQPPLTVETIITYTGKLNKEEKKIVKDLLAKSGNHSNSPQLSLGTILNAVGCKRSNLGVPSTSHDSKNLQSNKSKSKIPPSF